MSYRMKGSATRPFPLRAVPGRPHGPGTAPAGLARRGGRRRWGQETILNRREPPRPCRGASLTATPGRACAETPRKEGADPGR